MVNAPSTKGMPEGNVTLYSRSPHRGTEEQDARSKIIRKSIILMLFKKLRSLVNHFRNTISSNAALHPMSF